MKTEITEQNVVKAKEAMQALLNDDTIDLNYITIELLSQQLSARIQESEHEVILGSSVSVGPNGQTGQQGYYYYTDGNDKPCGTGGPFWVAQAFYNCTSAGWTCSNGSPVLKFTRR